MPNLFDPDAFQKRLDRRFRVTNTARTARTNIVTRWRDNGITNIGYDILGNVVMKTPSIKVINKNFQTNRRSF